MARALSEADPDTMYVPYGKSTLLAVSGEAIAVNHIIAMIILAILTIPVFSSLSPATRYQSAARLHDPLSSLRNAACAYSMAVGGSSALG